MNGYKTSNSFQLVRIGQKEVYFGKVRFYYMKRLTALSLAQNDI